MIPPGNFSHKKPVLFAVSTGDYISYEKSLRKTAGFFRITERKVIRRFDVQTCLWILTSGRRRRSAER
jgi:hypothetical protein